MRKKLKKLLNNNLAIFGLILCIILTLACIFAPLLTKYGANTVEVNEILLAPSKEHIMGTDQLGRDVFARLLYGGRISIAVGVISAIFGALIGTILGSISGYFSGKIDEFFVKLSELFQIFPSIILILLISSIIGQGVKNIIFIFSITGWMTTFRMVRNEFLSLKQENYVQVSKAIGMSNLRIIFKHILPNAMSPVIVALSLNVAGFILGEAGLSFLGVGVPVDVPTWGNIINAAKSLDVIQNNWWLWLIPGITISLFILSINFIGDGLRDIMDPKQGE
ncbi:ABC transporter permease [Sneathia sanguinegens]|uniref:ABC transporter permease n=1 Tax=Sneathia sanguinegens TaxID=40543 RepID=UPI00288B99B1|nr:ABC transporter permease [Sneathia sanguinegens]MDU7496480.1 ABC transporter permease [Sneathia sanguinegens]